MLDLGDQKPMENKFTIASILMKTEYYRHENKRIKLFRYTEAGKHLQQTDRHGVHANSRRTAGANWKKYRLSIRKGEWLHIYCVNTLGDYRERLQKPRRENGTKDQSYLPEKPDMCIQFIQSLKRTHNPRRHGFPPPTSPPPKGSSSNRKGLSHAVWHKSMVHINHFA